jgi:DNA-directed RNA polymerase beta subunit
MAVIFDRSLSLNHSIIAAFDDFIDQGVPHAVRRLKPIVTDGHCFALADVSIHKPGHLESAGGEYRTVTPAEAYLRNLDYRVMIRVSVTDHGRVFLESQLLCFLPLMVGSRHDPSRETEGDGTFIVEGVNRMIINAENLRPDAPHFICHDERWRCDVVSLSTRHSIYDTFTVALAGQKQVRLVDLLAALGAVGSLVDLCGPGTISAWRAS